MKNSESLPARGAWIEMVNEAVDIITEGVSLPARGAWIEMAAMLTVPIHTKVAPR